MDTVKPNKIFKENYAGHIVTVPVFTRKPLWLEELSSYHRNELHALSSNSYSNFNSDNFNKKGFGIEINHDITAKN